MTYLVAWDGEGSCRFSNASLKEGGSYLFKIVPKIDSSFGKMIFLNDFVKPWNNVCAADAAPVTAWGIEMLSETSCVSSP